MWTLDQLEEEAILAWAAGCVDPTVLEAVRPVVEFLQQSEDESSEEVALGLADA